jgi:hypothetical protein
MRQRPTTAENYGTLARRFQTMGKYLADSLDGLNSDRQFPILRQDIGSLRVPDGSTIGYFIVPRTLQELLYTLAGEGAQYRARRRRSESGAGEPAG